MKHKDIMKMKEKLKEETLKIKDIDKKGLWIQTPQKTGVFDIIDKVFFKEAQSD